MFNLTRRLKNPPKPPWTISRPSLTALSQMDQEWRDHLSQTNLPVRQTQEAEERRQFMFDTLVAGTSLQETLLEQMRFSDIPPAERPVAEMIIGNIDDFGYLKASIDELSFSTNIPATKIAEVLKVVQGFHPPGVGARDLRECLLLQLERAGAEENARIPDCPRPHGRFGQAASAGHRA